MKRSLINTFHSRKVGQISSSSDLICSVILVRGGCNVGVGLDLVEAQSVGKLGIVRGTVGLCCICSTEGMT